MPQWQGGNNPLYVLGAQLLAWLAPEADTPLIEVPTVAPDGSALERENGLNGRSVLLQQTKAARAIIDQHKPERIVMFGGDCLVDLAPFAYLNEKHDGKLGVLWIDAHPDVATPKERENGHTMVLGNLLGQGDEDLRNEVSVPLQPDRVMLAGLGRLSDQEAEFIEQHNLRTASPDELRSNPSTVANWIRETGIKHLAIHLDLDIFSPDIFRGTGFAKPPMTKENQATLRTGEMDFPEIVSLLGEVQKHTEVVAIGITEHLPYDVLNLQRLLQELPLLRNAD